MKSPKPTTTAGFVSDLLATSASAVSAGSAVSAAALVALVAGGGLGVVVAMEPTDEPTVKFSTKLTASNNRALERLAYWSPGSGKIQRIVNEALAAHFARHPDADRPTPEE